MDKFSSLSPNRSDVELNGTTGANGVREVSLTEPLAHSATKVKKYEVETFAQGSVQNLSNNAEDSMETDGVSSLSVKDEFDMEMARANPPAAQPQPANVKVAAPGEENLPDAKFVEQEYEVIIPSYAAWFSLDKINEIEKRANAEFFSNKNRSKTPIIYKDYRNFMVNTYRLNPTEYLTVTACRRNLAGDVCAIIRVHAFLEQWGLINYQVDPEAKPSLLGPAFTGHFRITADTPQGLVPFTPKLPGEVAPSAKAEDKDTNEINSDLRANIFAQNGKSDDSGIKTSGSLKKLKGVPKKYCTSCGAECSNLFYRCMKDNQVELCPGCYSDGRFPNTLYSGDFIKVDNRFGGLVGADREPEIVKGASQNAWNDQETMLLLEGLEMYDDEWDLIAQHVGSRTREECLLKFLQLPIEEPYTETDISIALSKSGINESILPFSATENPVMSLVAFLASSVNPGVASAAAKAAISELQKSESVGKSSVEKAAATALGAAAAKAKVLADYEERDLKSLINSAIELQMHKLEFKMAQLEELEALMDVERKDLEKMRLDLVKERLELSRKILNAKLPQCSPTALKAVPVGESEESEMISAEVQSLGNSQKSSDVKPVQEPTFTNI